MDWLVLAAVILLSVVLFRPPALFAIQRYCPTRLSVTGRGDPVDVDKVGVQGEDVLPLPRRPDEARCRDLLPVAITKPLIPARSLRTTRLVSPLAARASVTVSSPQPSAVTGDLSTAGASHAPEAGSIKSDGRGRSPKARLPRGPHEGAEPFSSSVSGLDGGVRIHPWGQAERGNRRMAPRPEDSTSSPSIHDGATVRPGLVPGCSLSLG